MADQTNKPPEETKPTPVPKKPRVVPELRAERMKQTEFVHNEWVVMVPHGTLPEDLKGHAYWAHVAHLLKRHDTIRCIWEDGWGEATVRVLAVGHAWVKVHLDEKLDVRQYPEFDQKQRTPGYTVVYVNNFAKWCVVREQDKKTLKDGCDTEGEAHIWLAQHIKAQTPS